MMKYRDCIFDDETKTISMKNEDMDHLYKKFNVVDVYDADYPKNKNVFSGYNRIHFNCDYEEFKKRILS